MKILIDMNLSPTWV
jgi:predicted nuclease of predicted toxin-antitoxin system